jgi:hypothetical protein
MSELLGKHEKRREQVDISAQGDVVDGILHLVRVAVTPLPPSHAAGQGGRGRSHRSGVVVYFSVPSSLKELGELDLKSLFGLHVHSCTHWLRPRNPPPPPSAPRIWAHI